MNRTDKLTIISKGREVTVDCTQLRHIRELGLSWPAYTQARLTRNHVEAITHLTRYIDGKTQTIAFGLNDWQSEDGEVPANPSHGIISLDSTRIDLQLADGRSLWIEMQDGVLRVHGYVPEATGHHSPANLDIRKDGFTFFAEELRDQDTFERSFDVDYLSSLPDPSLIVLPDEKAND